jgi:hypothetical protein
MSAGQPAAAVAPGHGPAEPAPGNGDYEGSRWEQCKKKIQKAVLGEPKEWDAPPVGYFVYLANRTQVANGDAVRMMLYHYDFCDGSDQLNLAGRDKLARIAAMLPCNAFPVVVERTPEDVNLGERRRLVVANSLSQFPFPIPPERVMVGAPVVKGLGTLDWLPITENLIRETASYGAAYRVIGAGFASGGGTGAGAGGGAGAGR